MNNNVAADLSSAYKNMKWGMLVEQSVHMSPSSIYMSQTVNSET